MLIIIPQCGSKKVHVHQSTTLVQAEILTNTDCVAMKFCTDIHGPKRMKPNDFVHPPPSSDHSFYLSSALVYDQIPVKLMTFPSGSAC